jgi:hypothetical protein
MNFFARYGGVETKTPWHRPTKDKVIQWKQSLDCKLDDWYIVGNFIEEYSPTWDVDIILIQKPLKLSLNDLSNTFTEMITKGFEHKLLIDACWMPEFYQDIWREIIKIRPDNQFYKDWNGDIYNPTYTADKVEKIHPQLWQYEYHEPHDNWYKGKERGYSFTGIPLSTYGDVHTYRPLPKEVTIKQSGIEGLGLFAVKDIRPYTDLGLTHIPNEEYENGYIRTPLGGFVNHSDNPNCKVVEQTNGNYHLVTNTHIYKGDELTLTYNLYKV